MQLALAVMLVGILANPLCVCADQPTTAPAQEKSCCKPPAEDSSLPIAPCDCETALNEGLLLAKQDFGKSQLFAPSLHARQVLEHGLGAFALSSPPCHFDIHGPPLRHFLSVYRL